MTSRLLRPLRSCGIAALALAAITCRDHPSGSLGLPFPASLAVAPGVTSVIGGPVFDLVGVRVTLSDFPDNALVLDTAVAFVPGDSTLRLALAVQLMRPAQDFYLRVAAVDLLGDTLFRALDTVTLRQNESAPRPASVVLQYSGPDTLVAAVSLSPRDTTIPIGIPLMMRPVAFGVDQSVLKDVRFGWRSSDPASIAVAPDGTVIALANAQGVWIVATTANGRRDSTQVSTSLPTIPTVASISIDSVFVSLIPGDSLLLRATPRDGQGLAVNYPITWTALDTILGIDSRGMVTGRMVGTGRIMATADKASDTASITVLNPQLAGAPAVRRTP